MNLLAGSGKYDITVVWFVVVAIMNGSPWLDLNDAARYIRRGKEFVRRQVVAGRLRAAKIDRKNTLRFRTEWLDDFVERCAPGPHTTELSSTSPDFKMAAAGDRNGDCRA